MASKRRRKKRIVEIGVDDRLSSLPDDLIHKILSFNSSTKETVETSVLSSRWRFVWTSTPYLDFSSFYYPGRNFSKFVTHVLSKRNKLVDVFSLKLHYSDGTSQKLVNKILKYVFSHNIQQLYISCMVIDDMKFPLSSLHSQSLQRLTLINKGMEDSVFNGDLSNKLKAMSTWELPALTTLFLSGITFCEDNTVKCSALFSKCSNLQNLTLQYCKAVDLSSFKKEDKLKSLSICHPRLSNLSLDDNRWKNFNVIAPQLKNLTISNWKPKQYVISAPELSSLFCSGSNTFHLSTEGFPSLETVDLSVDSGGYEEAVGTVRLFQEFKSVKYLTLELEIAELLSSYVKLISDHPSPFANLKMLKLYSIAESWGKKKEKKVKISKEVKSYLIDSSPGATFTMVTSKEYTTSHRYLCAMCDPYSSML